MQKKLLSKTLRKGFTLIELLVVIGIIAALAIAALTALSPQEVQKKRRDTQRLKDMQSIAGAIDNYLDDNPASLLTAGTVDSSNGKRGCRATENWTGIDLCGYLNTVPVDPLNKRAKPTDPDGAVTQARNVYYFLVTTTSQYKLCTYLESVSNRGKLNNTGRVYTPGGNMTGSGASTFATGSDLTQACP